MTLVGASLGFLIGAVSGLAVVLLIQTAAAANRRPLLRTVVAEISELLAIPTFWFGGTWMTGRLLSAVDFTAILPSYLLMLAFTFTVVSAYPLSMLVVALGNRIRQAGVKT